MSVMLNTDQSFCVTFQSNRTVVNADEYNSSDTKITEVHAENFPVSFVEINGFINEAYFFPSFKEVYAIPNADASMPDSYTGIYSVTPTLESQTLLTAEKYCTSNVTVAAIPVTRTANTTGTTVTIGG